MGFLKQENQNLWTHHSPKDHVHVKVKPNADEKLLIKPILLLHKEHVKDCENSALLKHVTIDDT